MTPTGHLQVVEKGSGRRFIALWRDAHGKRHKKVIGKAWVKAYGKTPRGATRWRGADGPKPGPEYLTPREADDWLRRTLADATINEPPKPFVATVSFHEAALEWLRYIEFDRERSNTTVRDYHNTVYGALI